MGISPFMAFTKGAFEGYNQLQDEERATIAETGRQLQIAKAKALAEGNMFTSDGEGGLLTHSWKLSDAKAEKDRHVDNIQSVVKNFSPAYMNGLQENSPNRYNSIMGQMYNYFTRYKVEHMKTLDSGKTLIPNEKLLPDVMNNSYWGPHWAKVIGGQVEGAYTHITQEGENVAVENIRPTQKTHGFDTTKGFNAWAYFHAKRRGDTSVNTPEAAGNKYSMTYSKIAPLYVSNLLMPEMLPDGTIKSSPMAISSNEPGKFLTIGMALEEITKGGIADQGLVNGLDYTIRMWNKTEGKDRPITNSDLIQGLKLASVTEHSTSSESSIYDTKIGGAGSGGPYLKEVLMLDIEHIRSKVNAGQEVKRTIGEIEKVYEENFAIGQHPPSSTFANNVVQMFSAFFEEGNIKDQIGDSLRKKTMSVFGVKTDDTALAYLQRSYDAQMKDSKDSSASAGARMEFYQNMLAYQLAVAIQGGTGGRTVSDQDVINMRKAFGNRLFSNGVVQLSVLKEINLFVDDIIDSNKFLVESADGTVADAKAANAFHKMKANGLDLKTAATSYGSRATEAFGAMLDNRLTTGIENKAINIIEPTLGFNIDGQKRAEFVNSEYVLPIPNFRKLTDKGAPTFGYSRGKNLMEIGQNIYISATRGEFDDKGIYALYRDSNELDKDGKKIVELQPNVTISMVSDYLEKLAQVARQSVEGQEYANKYYDHAKGFDK